MSAFALVPLSSTALAQNSAVAPPSGPVRVQLDSMPLGALATLLMRDVMRVPYVISSDVLGDHRPVSVNLVMPRAELPLRVVQFLRSQGLTVQLNGGTVYVSKGAADSGFASAPNVPSGSPLAGPPPVAGSGVHSGSVDPQMNEPLQPQVLAIIEPAFRPVLELAEVLEGVLPELAVAARGGSRPSGAGISDRLEPDRLVISGVQADVERAAELVRLLDKPRPSVEIRAVVFEVRNTQSRSSALSILAELGGLDLGVRPGDAPGEQFLRIATGGIRAVLSATRGDGRFRIVAEPSLVAMSGTVATLNAGSQVPTVGAVSYGEDGTPVRSIVYRDSGVILRVRPIVRSGEIELAVEQERSSFARTTTGVDESPTLNRSTASAQVTLAPGETVALAGLDERTESDTRAGFFGGLLGSREREKGDGQLLLLVQADLADDTRQGETKVEFIGMEPVSGGGSHEEGAVEPEALGVLLGVRRALHG